MGRMSKDDLVSASPEEVCPKQQGGHMVFLSLCLKSMKTAKLHYLHKTRNTFFYLYFKLFDLQVDCIEFSLVDLYICSVNRKNQIFYNKKIKMIECKRRQ